LPVIPPQRGGELLVETYTTEELGMAFSSVEAAVEGRDDSGNHLMLAARERQLRRKQNPESGHAVEKCPWNQTMRLGNAVGTAVGSAEGRHLSGIFRWE